MEDYPELLFFDTFSHGNTQVGLPKKNHPNDVSSHADDVLIHYDINLL